MPEVLDKPVDTQRSVTDLERMASLIERANDEWTKQDEQGGVATPALVAIR